MKWQNFSTVVPGKWVLAGEHTVLRGGRAIALPHPEFKLHLEFRAADTHLSVEPDLGLLVVQELLKLAKDWLAARSLDDWSAPRGALRITSTIPFGAGLGSSAALSVAVARWVLSAYALDRNLERELARELENRFHGKSSGMDVAVVSIGEPILFSMRDGAVGLGLRELPSFVFFDTGLRAVTKDCIEKVENLRTRDPVRADHLDQGMRLATEEILEGLREYNGSKEPAGERGKARARIAAGMARAGEIYRHWGLVPEEVEGTLARLSAEGVVSPRLTGAGGGGFIVGLAAVATDS